MPRGMRIAATTSVGTIKVTALDELTRSYTWEGATRAVQMVPRPKRWYGSLGLFFPGPGEHWRDHKGITRCVTEEGEQRFKSVEEAQEWIKKRTWMPFVYRDDGLMVGWNKNFPRKQLSVEVWQILIDGKKPTQLPGSENQKIVVETVETETVPLAKAVVRNDLTDVHALLAKGADVNAKNSVEVPILLVAVRHGLAPIVEALLKYGADPNVRDPDDDMTPLLEANGQVDIIKALLAAGADVNAAVQNKENLLVGMTPVIYAAMSGSEDIVRLLIAKGANVNAKTPMGMTALSWARLSEPEKNSTIIRMLEAAGARE